MRDVGGRWFCFSIVLLSLPILGPKTHKGFAATSWRTAIGTGELDPMPAPYSIAPSFTFEGSDGNWTTFEISVGSPPQTFRILPSTAVSETWIPIPQGCGGVLEGLPECGDLRGVNDFDGSASLGFQTNASSSWNQIGIYNLATEDALFDSDSDTGLYGSDVITIPSNVAGDTARLESQVIAGVATANVWLGVLGLGARSANFSVESENLPSLLDEMKSQNITPSLSFGYTAGSSYSSPGIPGSLVLGGYDSARLEPDAVSFANGGETNQTLPVQIQSIVAENVPSGTMSLLADGLPVTANIDTTVSQMYLPQSACDLFQQAFGLEYDSVKDFYLVNNTAHNELLQSNPSVTFTIGDTGSSGLTTNIVFPYSAFDLAVRLPFYNNDTRYFPIRVAKDESQQVLGRAFLQEAYVVVDWERNNFTIGQAIHQRQETRIVSIEPLSADQDVDDSGLSTGAIAGIAVAVVAAVITLCVIAFFAIRARRRRPYVAAHIADYPPDHKDASELGVAHSNLSEVHDSQVFELHEGHVAKHELPAGLQVPELHGNASKMELEDTSSNYASSEKKERVVHEMP